MCKTTAVRECAMLIGFFKGGFFFLFFFEIKPDWQMHETMLLSLLGGSMDKGYSYVRVPMQKKIVWALLVSSLEKNFFVVGLPWLTQCTHVFSGCGSGKPGSPSSRLLLLAQAPELWHVTAYIHLVLQYSEREHSAWRGGWCRGWMRWRRG